VVNRAYTRLARVALGRRLPPIYDEESLWYQGWYFDLRLEEEIARATRYRLPLALVVICIPVKALGQNRAGLSACLAEIATSRRLRRSDIPAVLTSNELAVFLPHTTPDQAENVVKRLARSLAAFQPAFGIASYPRDSEEPNHLLLVAEERALAEVSDGGLTARAMRPRRRVRRRAAETRGSQVA
jgi:GGDEF domain-containing protein